MKKVELLPNFITAFGLSCGLFAIFKLVMVKEIDLRVLTVSALIILLAAICDLLDGAVARAMKAESAFGSQFDSLADAITFGLAPSVFVLRSHPVEAKTILSFLLTTSAMVFSMCGILRLIRYNLSSKEKLINPDVKYFTGLPIPAAAMGAISLNLFLFSDEFSFLFPLQSIVKTSIICIVLYFLGYLMVSRIRYHSIQSFQLKVGTFSSVLFIVATASFIFYGFFHIFATLFFLVVWSYIIGSFLMRILKKLRGSKEPLLVEEDEDLGI